MTIIEFYDRTSLDNIAGALLCEVDHIVLIGDNRGKMAESKVIYDKILQGRGKSTTISYMSVNRNKLSAIVNVLTKLISNEESYIFDLTGGDDLCLVAVGILMQTLGEQIQCHRFNFRNNTLYDCDADGNVCATLPFRLSVDECISIYGGRVVRDDNAPLHTFRWRLEGDFIDDVNIMWNICKRDVSLWNVKTFILSSACDLAKIGESMEYHSDVGIFHTALENKHIDFDHYKEFLYELERNSLISSLNLGEQVSFIFKNNQVKRCITLPGQILELVVATKMQTIMNEDGEPLYQDINVGVVIDWDTEEKNEQHPTINEIDVLAMKDMIPIFVSCKNGNFDETELYKLKTVAERFGGKYAKKVLVATKLDKFGLKSDFLKARMRDMDIKYIENLAVMSDEEIDQAFRFLWL